MAMKYTSRRTQRGCHPQISTSAPNRLGDGTNKVFSFRCRYSDTRIMQKCATLDPRRVTDEVAEIFDNLPTSRVIEIREPGRSLLAGGMAPAPQASAPLRPPLQTPARQDASGAPRAQATRTRANSSAFSASVQRHHPMGWAYRRSDRRGCPPNAYGEA